MRGIRRGRAFGRAVSVGVVGLALALAVAAAQPATAQDQAQDLAGLDEDALRARQNQLFDVLFEDPDDLDLMFDYALTSIALEDYEAAISTLERMLIYEPNLPRVRLELGAAYFRLGAYQTAEYYFASVREDPATPPEVAARVDRFLAEVDRRTRRNVVSGEVSAGVTYSTNANLGPNDAEVLVTFPGADDPAIFRLDDDDTEEGDVGFRALATIRHSYDLDRPRDDAWVTDFAGFTLHYADESSGDVDLASLRTGPRLALTAEQFGPTLRPFAEVDFVRSDNDPLYATFGGGLEFTDSVGEGVGVFASVRSGYRDFFEDRDGFDGTTHRVVAGAAYAPTRDLVLRGSIIGEADFADDDFNTNGEIGGRIGVLYSYAPGLDFVDRPWVLRGFGQITGRFFDEPDPVVDPDESRRDRDFRLGVSHDFNLVDGWRLRAEVDALRRESNIRNFELDSVSGTLSVGYAF